MNFKNISHWTPHYIYNRVKLFINERIHPDWPWLVREAVLYLDNLLTKESVGLEFGSGRSTIWFAKRIKKLISIEHDKNWFDKIESEIKKQNINNIDYRLKTEKKYTDIFNEIKDNSLDFVLVDGLLRDVCVKKSIPKIKNGGLLIIDNINWFAPSDSRSPASKRNNEFDSEIWREVFEKDIKNWRKIWTSNGVFDTLIVFK